MTVPSILIIDDDDILRNRLEKSFQKRSFDVHSVDGVSSAAEKIKTLQPDYAVVDLKMPDGSGSDRYIPWGFSILHKKFEKFARDYQFHPGFREAIEGEPSIYVSDTPRSRGDLLQLGMHYSQGFLDSKIARNQGRSSNSVEEIVLSFERGETREKNTLLLDHPFIFMPDGSLQLALPGQDVDTIKATYGEMENQRGQNRIYHIVENILFPSLARELFTYEQEHAIANDIPKEIALHTTHSTSNHYH